MSGAGPQPSCACPRVDPVACMHVRYGRDQYTYDAAVFGIREDDREECECSCHDVCNCCHEDYKDCMCEEGPF